MKKSKLQDPFLSDFFDVAENIFQFKKVQTKQSQDCFPLLREYNRHFQQVTHYILYFNYENCTFKLDVGYEFTSEAILSVHLCAVSSSYKKCYFDFTKNKGTNKVEDAKEIQMKMFQQIIVDVCQNSQEILQKKDKHKNDKKNSKKIIDILATEKQFAEVIAGKIRFTVGGLSAESVQQLIDCYKALPKDELV